MANGPYASIDIFVKEFIQLLADDEYSFNFAIIEKPLETTPQATAVADTDDRGDLVGMIALSEANDEDRSVVIGHVHVFPSHRGRGVGTAAGRLLLTYALNQPHLGGLGLHRVEWHASTKNEASIALARKLGFGTIGIVRYERLLKAGKTRGKIGNGLPSPPGSDPDDLFRDLVMFALDWDAWPANKVSS